MFEAFQKGISIDEIGDTRQGLATGDNKKFIRFWHEIDFQNIGFNHISNKDFISSKKLYAPFNKGGSFRRWFGNLDYVIKFDQTNFNLLLNQGNHLPSKEFYFKKSISWSKVSSSLAAFRFFPVGFVFDGAGSSAFINEKYEDYSLGFLNSKVAKEILGFISPTLNYEAGHIALIPLVYENSFDKEIGICMHNY